MTMKDRNMKKILTVCLALICLTLCACTPKKQYVDNVASSALADNVIAAIGASEDYMSADADHYDFYFGESSASASVLDHALIFSRAETDVNEFGIFRVKSEGYTTVARVDCILTDDFENMWAEYMTAYEACEPEIFFADMQQEVYRRMESAE